MQRDDLMFIDMVKGELHYVLESLNTAGKVSDSINMRCLTRVHRQTPLSILPLKEYSLYHGLSFLQYFRILNCSSFTTVSFGDPGVRVINNNNTQNDEHWWKMKIWERHTCHRGSHSRWCLPSCHRWGKEAHNAIETTGIFQTPFLPEQPSLALLWMCYPKMIYCQDIIEFPIFLIEY